MSFVCDAMSSCLRGCFFARVLTWFLSLSFVFFSRLSVFWVNVCVGFVFCLGCVDVLILCLIVLRVFVFDVFASRPRVLFDYVHTSVFGCDFI